ncbi:MAG TPA: glycosyltransferase, partial [Candidatus Thermoplasmatota archaeon]|nr:glycosyltransferase [Candidatus Thermoplasmatota archaeon]
MAPLVSVVIPTYNEGANIGPLLSALQVAFAGVEAEFLVVDDSSRDGTGERARLHPARPTVIVRTGERGLATAVVRGIQEAQGTFVAVMDADFQHPPAAVRR